MTHSYFIALFFFVLGSVIGSFLNVCIVRMPQEKSVIKPGSHCVHCLKPLFWYDNIPLLGYMFLKGRCRFCKGRISFRYFFVELLTAATFACFYWYFGLTLALAAYVFMVSCFIIAIFVDLEHRIIPDQVSVGGMMAGLIFSLFIPELHGVDTQAMSGIKPYVFSFLQSLGGALVGGGSIYLMGVLGDFIFRKESMGGGDVKLMAMIGAFLGWQSALLTFFIAPFFGAFYGIIEKIRTKDSAIAYGPFLVLGALISLFYGRQLLDLIWNYSLYQYYK